VQQDHVHEVRSGPSGASGRDSWLVVAVSIAMVCLFGTVFAVGLAVRYKDEGAGAGSPGGIVEYEIELGDLWVKPSSIEVPAGGSVVLAVTNVGAMPHDLKLDGTDGTAMLDPGESEEITLGPFEADAIAWCTVPGHREAGMALDIVVAGGTASHGGMQTVAATGSGSGNAEIDFTAEPADGWKPFDPDLAPAPGGTEHQITFRADEVVLEVAPGVTQEMWVFEGQVPGPTLRGKVGDIFTVTLVNDGEVGHSIDFHASKVAWNDEMRTLQPGESLVYQFEAKHAGIFMYHCGTAPALHHIGNGMFGALIVDPPDLPEVDHEYVFVQSEIYTGPEGGPGDLTKMQNDAWDAVVFNGYVSQYLHAPIRVESGERVRAWVLDAGPSENSSFHIVGTIFDTVYKEGTYLLRPDQRRGGAQALDLQPAQGGFVEFTFDEDGLYPIVTHKFSNVGKGALGLFQSGEVDPSATGGH
jgi:nitrite reductase (NO-forming)